MAGNTKDLTLKFKVTDEGTIVLDKISQKMGNVSESAQKMNKSLSIIKLDSIVNLGRQAIEMGEKIYGAARSTAALGDEIVRNAKIVAMSTTEYQKWGYVAFRSDVAQDQLATGLKILSRNMLEASQGGKEALETFDKLGINILDNAGKIKTYDEILGDLTEAFSKLKDGPEKVALALKAFGRSGEALLPLLDKGKRGLQEYREEFVKFGMELDERTLKTLSLADEKFERFEKRSSTLWSKIKMPFTETVADVVDFLTRLSAGHNIIESMREMMEEKWAIQIEAPEWIKKWVKEEYMVTKEETKFATSRKNSIDEYVKSLKAAEEGRKKDLDYVKKLKDYYDLVDESTDKRVKAEEEYQRVIKEISPDDPERGKKVQAAIDAWMKGIKQIEEEIKKAKPMDIKVTTDKAEQEINAFIQKMEAKGIQLPISVIGRGSGGGEQISWGDYVKGDIPFFQGGKSSGAVMDLTAIENKLKGISDINVDIGFYGTGSTKKPIIEKIREIIAEFGGLEKALSGLAANINLAELTAQYDKLNRTLQSVSRYPAEISKVLSAGGNPFGWYSISPEFWRPMKEQQQELTDQMKILSMKMDYEKLRAMGSFQHGTDYVPRTGLYRLDEGEKVYPRNVTMGSINITINGTRDPRTTADELVKVLKYRLSGELRGLI